MENINIKLYRNIDNILMTLYRKEVYNYPYNKGGGFDENWIWFRYINKCNLEITGKIVYSMLDNANIFSNIKEHTKLLISLNLTIKGNGKYYIKDSGVSYEVKKINFINEEFIKKQLRYVIHLMI